MVCCRDSVIAAQLKDEDRDREYNLAVAPMKRILKEGSHEGAINAGRSTLTDFQITEAALLLFRRHVEDYALLLAAEIGEITDNAMRNKIAVDDVIIAIGG